MKIKHYFLALMAIAGLAVGCQKSENGQGEEASLKLSVSELSFPADSEHPEDLTKTLTVTSNRDWKVVEDLSQLSWIKVTADGEDVNGKRFPASGNPVTISVSVEPNDDVERSGKLTFNGGTGAKANLKIVQQGNVDFNELVEVLAAFKTAGKDTMAIEEAVIVKTLVVSNSALDNLGSNKSMYVQDESAGINVYCDANHDLKFGDEVIITLQGAKVTKYGGAPEIVGIGPDKFRTVSTGNVIEPEEISYAELKGGKFEGMYITLNEDVQVVDEDLTKTWLMDSKATSINIENRTGDSFVVRSGKYSKYGSETVPQGSGRIAGICTFFNGAPQLIFAQDSDRQGMTGPRFSKEESDMVIEPAKLSFAATGDLSATVNVTCSRDWSVVETFPEWLDVTKDGKSIEGETIEGSEEAVELTVTVLENGDKSRNQTLTLNDNTSTKNVLTISQEGTVGFDTLKDIIDAYKAGGKEEDTIQDKIVKAFVVSNSDLDNLGSNKSMYVQDETAGINVFCAANHSFKFGDELEINLDGAKIKKYGGVPEIDGLDLASCTVVSTGNTIQPELISFADMASGKYEGCYVKVNDVQVTEADLTKTWVVGSAATSINMEVKNGGTFVVRSGKYSKYGSETVAQGSGAIAGIATTFNGASQLIFAQDSDRQGMTGERFKQETKNLTVAQVIAARSGNGVTEGRVICLGPDGFILNDGGQQNLFVYTKSAPAVAVSDIVKVSGAFKEYSNVVEYSEPKVESSTATIPESPVTAAKVLSDDDIVAYTGDKSSQYVSFSGTLQVDGNYLNVILASTDKVMGSLKSATDVKAFDGMQVEVIGYFIGQTGSGKYFSILLDEIKTSGKPYLRISPVGSTTVQASATSQTINVMSNTDWTVSSDNAAFEPDVTSGSDNGTITVTFPANTDPDNEKTATITVSSEVGEYTLTIIQKKYTAPGSVKLVKVTSEPADWTGDYLLVYEEDKIAFDGSLSADKGHNVVEGLEISGGEISDAEKYKDNIVSLAKVDGGYSFKAASGKYLSGEASANKLNYKDTPTAVTVSLSGGNVIITSGRIFQFNSTSGDNNYRFRFYGEGKQKAVQIYKLSE